MIYKQYEDVLAKSVTDSDFRSRLQADPAGTLRAEGIKVPEGMDVKVVESTGDTFYVALPPSPEKALSDAELESVAAAGSFPGSWSVGCCG